MIDRGRERKGTKSHHKWRHCEETSATAMSSSSSSWLRPATEGQLIWQANGMSSHICSCCCCCCCCCQLCRVGTGATSTAEAQQHSKTTRGPNGHNTQSVSQLIRDIAGGENGETRNRDAASESENWQMAKANGNTQTHTEAIDQTES